MMANIFAAVLTVIHDPCTLSKNKWSRGNVQHHIYKATGRTSYFSHKDWSRLTNACSQTQHEGLCVSLWRKHSSWGEVALFLKMNFRGQVNSVVHQWRWNEAEEIVSSLDLAMSVCRRGVNITGVLLIFASRKSLCWGCVVYRNYKPTWCLSPRRFVLRHTEITCVLFGCFKAVISYIFIWLYLFMFPPQVHLDY